jgi:alginate O-acetyltransferase complex protein AlgI
MFFNSLTFAVFFAVTWGLYLCLPRRGQNVLLLLASYFFYACWDWRFLSLILISTAVDYAAGQVIARAKKARLRKAALLASVGVNLGMLGFFKYFDFFAEGLQALLAPAGLSPPLPVMNVVLPVGISFYTFQTMSYTIDIYRGKIAPTRDPVAFALFVAFFPQLVAGPIERAARLLPQIEEPRRIGLEALGSGTALILFGYFQKVVIADNLALVVDGVYGGPHAANGLAALVATWAFAVQILCDFAGYSNIARGLAMVMGFDLMKNFSAPYFAANPVEFWQRWHISLSTWLRDYLYIPLGGNREGNLKTLRNLLAVMLLGGLWHGAALTFVIWGAWHGLLLALHRLWQGVAPAPGGGEGASAVRRVFSAAVFFQLVCIGWVFFRSGSTAEAAGMLSAILSPGSWSAGREIAAMLHAAAPPMILWFFFEVLHVRGGRTLAFREWPLPARAAAYTAIFYAIVIFGVSDAQSFIYFQF